MTQQKLFSTLLTAGLLGMLANLVVSAYRGAPAGPNPFGGATLEWATTSPPPPYNFAVIPRVTSAYASWDDDDRADDRRRLESGELVLETGHETTASTPVDGHLDDKWVFRLVGGRLTGASK